MKPDIEEEHKKEEEIYDAAHEYNTHLDVDSFSRATGLELTKQLGKWISMGVFMGVSDAVPGYSGGTTLSLMGVYSRLVLMAKSVFKPEPGITRLKAIIWMLPFAMGWMLGVFGFAKLTELMVSHHYGLELMFAFGAFVLTAIPMFVKGERPNIGFKPKVKDEKSKNWFVRFKHNNLTTRDLKHIWYRRLAFITGLLIILALAVGEYFKGGVPFDGKLDDLDGDGKIDKEFPITSWSLTKLFLVAYAAGAVTIIPGGSGAVIQLIFGEYRNIHWRILANAHLNLVPLVIFAVSTFAGMVSTIFALAKILKSYHSLLASLSFGMLISSLVAIFIVPQTDVWHNLRDGQLHIWGVLVATLLGAASGVLISRHIYKRIVKLEKETQRKLELEKKNKSKVKKS